MQRCVARARAAVELQPPDAIRGGPVNDRPHQPRLADPCLSGENDYLASSGARLGPRDSQARQVAVTSQQTARRQARPFRFKPRGNRRLTQHQPRLHGPVVKPVERQPPEIPIGEETASQSARRLSDDHPAGWGGGEQSHRKVLDRPDHQPLRDGGIVCCIPDDNGARGDANAHLEVDVGKGRRGPQRRDERQPSPNRTLFRVLARGLSKRQKGAVAGKVVDVAVVFAHHPADHLPERAEDQPLILYVQAICNAGRIDQVGRRGRYRSGVRPGAAAASSRTRRKTWRFRDSPARTWRNRGPRRKSTLIQLGRVWTRQGR